MALHPCADAIRCPCDDSPLLNYSSEGAEAFMFIALNFGDAQDPPPLVDEIDPEDPQGWTATGCVASCESGVSQEEADACAQRQQVQCQADNERRPVFLSHEASCTAHCGGNDFTVTLPPGEYFGFTQAQADGAAGAAACRAARQRKICLGALTKLESCMGAEYSGSITATGAINNFWEIISGSLPAGLTLNQTSSSTVTITGTPTQSGTFTFSVQVVAGSGDYAFRSYTLCIVGITSFPAETTTGALPDATAATVYSCTLEAPSCATAPLSWQISSGALPPGLTLDEGTGAITGTPTTAGSYSFTIRLQTAAT